jgi:tRNA (guanine37-N1)-methyltransferase
MLILSKRRSATMRMLKEALKNSLTPSEVDFLSSSFDVIGSIAILKIPEELRSKEERIGSEILSRMKNVRTVLNQVSDVGGEFRTRDLRLVAGVENYDTVYRERGCFFKVNVREVYFSPRLSTERERIARLVQEGEKIFNMFAGVGTFSVIIAKEKRCTIESVDKNPAAFELGVESLKMNKKLCGTVIPVLAEAKDYAVAHKNIFDRVLMPLPERSSEFLPHAILSCKDRAIIHYYLHLSEEDFFSEGWIEKHLSSQNLDPSVRLIALNWKRVREVGPRYIQAVADLKVARA